MASETIKIRELIPGQPECRLLSHVLNRIEKVNAFTIGISRCVVHVVIPRMADGSLDQASAEGGTDTTENDIADPDITALFETILYDTMDKGWAQGAQGERLDADMDEIERPAAFFDMEQKAHRLVYELVIKKLLAGTQLVDGAQIWARLQTNAESGEVEAIIDGDMLRDRLVPQLPSLKPGEYSSIPRLEVGRLTYMGMYQTGIWQVDIDWPSNYPRDRPNPKHAVFKSVYMPDTFPVDPTSPAALDRMVTEAITLHTIPPHPRIVPMLAIVVVKQDEQPDTLVGWIMPKYAGAPWEFRHQYHFGWTVPFVQDLAEALSHCHRVGVYHGDVATPNVLLTDEPPHGRAVLIDFERLEYYTYKSSPPPEIQGHWDTTLVEGVLVYEEVPAGRRIDRRDSFLTELAAMPEAMERLEVFSFGLAAAQILHIDLEHPWEDPNYKEPRRSYGPSVPPEGNVPEDDDSDTDDEDEREPAPADVQALVRRCCSYHPQDRPLFDEIVREMGSGSFSFARPAEAAPTDATSASTV